MCAKSLYYIYLDVATLVCSELQRLKVSKDFAFSS